MYVYMHVCVCLHALVWVFVVLVLESLQRMYCLGHCVAHCGFVEGMYPATGSQPSLYLHTRLSTVGEANFLFMFIFNDHHDDCN